MSNSKLISYIRRSPNCNKPRNHPIDTITIHHMAGNLSIESCGALFAKSARQASSNYGIGSDGRVGLYVDEENRSWCSGSRENDHRAVTIEVANDKLGGEWHVSDKALETLIELCADICRRNGIAALRYTGNKSGNLTLHKWFQATNCPGPYLESKLPYIAAEVNRLLGGEETKQEGECTVTLKVLKKGAKGSAVKALQTLLIGYGYSCGSAGADGSFGGATDKALRAYQQKNGLTVDGSCGGATWKKLLGE